MNRPLLLLRQTRENLTETEFYGFIVFCSAEKEIKAFPDPAGYPVFSPFMCKTASGHAR